MKAHFYDHPSHLNLNDFFFDICHRFHDETALEHAGKKMTYAELEQKSTYLSCYLSSSLGIKPGDRVAIMLPNCLQYHICIFAILLSGGIVVNINPQYTTRELQHQLTDSGAKTIIILENIAHTLEQCISQTSVNHVILSSLGDCLPTHVAVFLDLHLRFVKNAAPRHNLKSTLPLSKLMLNCNLDGWKPHNSDFHDVALLQYTGGTTGPSKGAMLTHKNILYNICQGLHSVKEDLFRQNEQTTVLHALPLYHIFSLTVSLIAMSQGARGILITNPKNTDTLIDVFRSHDIHGVALIHTLMASLMENKKFHKISWKNLRQTINGGMKTSKDVAEQWFEKTGCVVDEGYGLSETSPIVGLSAHKDQFGETVGKPVLHTLVKIVSADGQDASFQKHGEVWIKGPQVMTGYWNNPEATHEAVTADGWFKTGDIGTITASGELRLIDRIKDIIIVSGFNIYPREVEEVIESHPEVRECGVVGEGDLTKEVITAYIVTHSDKVSDRSIIAHCRNNLAAYKIPKKIVFVSSLPKSNIGKVLRRKLRAA